MSRYIESARPSPRYPCDAPDTFAVQYQESCRPQPARCQRSVGEARRVRFLPGRHRLFGLGGLLLCYNNGHFRREP